jgi:hypothetical protein
MDWSRVEFWFNTALALYICNLLLLKALLLRRETPLGGWLAATNVAFAALYFGVALRGWFPFFDSEPWLWVMRIAIAATCTMVLLEFRRTFGGWREMRREVVRSLRSRPPPDREGY